MAVVKGGQLQLFEPLHDREYSGVNKPHIGVGVPVTQFADTPVIFGLQCLDAIRAGDNVIEEGV